MENNTSSAAKTETAKDRPIITIKHSRGQRGGRLSQATKDSIAASLGLTKVRGSTSGRVYYE